MILAQNSGAILGNYAESSPPNKNNDLFVIGFGDLPPVCLTDFKPSKNSSNWGFDEKTKEIYALQGMARKSMLEHFYSLSKEEQQDMKAHRVCGCRRDLRPVLTGEVSKSGKKLYDISEPAVFAHKETGNPFLGGTVVCGSPWACPVCSPKISEVRSAEIRQSVTEWVKSGGICLFITLTFPHSSDDSLSSLVERFKGTLTRFRKGKAFDKIKEELGYFGLIRSIETTWGEANGWHPHSHEIWFVRPDFIEKAKEFLVQDVEFSVDVLTALCDFYLKPVLFKQWRSAVVKSGLSEPSYERGMVIKACETEEQLVKRLTEYLVKTGIEKPPWGVDDELTKLHSKRGKPGRFTPFDFLRQQFDPELTKGQKYKFRLLFADYVDSFKGVAKIFWSRGLKSHFQVKDLTDEDIAEERIEKSIKKLGVPIPFWVCVIEINDHRAALMLKVKNEGVQAAFDYLYALAELYEDRIFGEGFDSMSPSSQYLIQKYVFDELPNTS